MIKNERQYKLSKAYAADFLATVQQLRDADKPDGMPELLWKAQIDSVESQYNDLKAEISEYEQLQKARPASIHASSLEALPMALIKARIALGLSHKDLADRMKLKEQQIQRYEATDYSTATIKRLNEVALALGVTVSESISLPQFAPTKSALIERLSDTGISGDFLFDKILPSDIASEFDDPENEESAVHRSVSVLQRIFKWEPEAIFGVTALSVPQSGMATARFKIPAGPPGRRLSAYIAYAHYIAIVVANACKALPKSKLCTDPLKVRERITKDGKNIELEDVVEYFWDNGVPVIPLDDTGVFHGASWRIDGRNVVVVKQKSSFNSRWVFDLLHEFHHAAQNPDNLSHSWIEDSELTSTRRSSPEEQAANKFAGDVLLNGQAERLVSKCVEKAKGNVSFLKNTVQSLSNAENIPVEHLANYLAYRLSLQNINWWGTASNLQNNRGTPFKIVRDIFMKRFDFKMLNEIDAKILQRALIPSGEETE